MELEFADNLVSVRTYRRDDVTDLYEAIRESVAEVGRFETWCHPGYARHESAAWVESRPRDWRTGTEYSFLITEPASGRILGGCGLNKLDKTHLRANLGYWVRTSATRRGYATAAARLLARFGVEHLMLERIEIVAAVDNLASQRVAEKLGAVREGVARNRLRIHDVLYDAVVFSLLRAEIRSPMAEVSRQREAP